MLRIRKTIYYKYTLLGCLGVCLYPTNVETAGSGPNFVWDLTSKLEKKILANSWNLFLCQFEKKNPPNFENHLKWQTFRATVKI